MHDNETDRLESLYSYQLLDDMEKKELDSIVDLAASICQVPISLLTLVDSSMQWHLAQCGDMGEGVSREHSFCSHLIDHDFSELIIEDTRSDARFHDNPLVTGPPHIVFYAGVPLITSDGYRLGALCVIDHKPKEINEAELNALRTLSRQVMHMLELHRTVREMRDKEEQLEQNIANLEEYTAFIAHDLRNPFRNIEIITEVMLRKHQNDLDQESLGYLKDIIGEAEESREFIQDLLRYSKSIHSFNKDAELVNTEELFSQILMKTRPPEHFYIKINSGLPQLFYPKVALRHVFRNILENAIKYNQSAKPTIQVSYEEDEEYHIFKISDNGNGIPKELHHIIFKLFSGDLESDGKFIKSIGVGLAIVSKLVALMNGTVEVDSTVGQGSTFIIRLPIIIVPV